MSKKKWLGLILGIIFIAWLIYQFNVFPWYTNKANYVLAYLQTGFGTNPIGITAAVTSTAAGVTALAGKLYSRAKSGVEGTYNMVIGEKNRQFDELSNSWSQQKTLISDLEGKVTTYKSSLESTQTMLTDTQQKLADVTTELRRKTDQAQAMAEVKIGALSKQTQAIKLQDAMKAVPGADPVVIKNALEAAGFTVTVE